MNRLCYRLYISVPVPPTVYNLKNVTGAEGHEVTLVCLSYGDPPPTMAFRKTNKSEPYRMGENVSICVSFILNFMYPVKGKSKGLSTCYSAACRG